jgi:hypothetical protein
MIGHLRNLVLSKKSELNFSFDSQRDCLDIPDQQLNYFFPGIEVLGDKRE